MNRCSLKKPGLPEARPLLFSFWRYEKRKGPASGKVNCVVSVIIDNTMAALTSLVPDFIFESLSLPPEVCISSKRYLFC